MIGENLKALRDKQGWSQTELANRAGTKQKVISGIESGAVKRPTAKTIEACAAALGVNPSFIWGYDAGKKSAKDTDHISMLAILQRIESRLAAIEAKIDHHETEDARRVIEHLAAVKEEVRERLTESTLQQTSYFQRKHIVSEPTPTYSPRPIPVKPKRPEPYVRTKYPRWQANTATRYNHDAGAGGVHIQEIEGNLMDATEQGLTYLEWVNSITPEPCPFANRVRGDSMEPTILDGAMVYHTRSYWEQVRDGDIVVVFDKQAEELRVRRVHMDRDGGRCVLRADNPRHQGELACDDESSSIVGVVLYADNEWAGTPHIGGGASTPRRKR